MDAEKMRVLEANKNAMTGFTLSRCLQGSLQPLACRAGFKPVSSSACAPRHDCQNGSSTYPMKADEILVKLQTESTEQYARISISSNI